MSNISTTSVDQLLQNPGLQQAPVLLGAVPDSTQPSAETTESVEQEQPQSNRQESSNEDSPQEKTPESSSSTIENSGIDTDDYGQPVSKKERLYTESELQEKIRDRLSRGQYAQQQQVEAPKQQYEPQYAQQQQEGEWQQELEQFIDKTLTKRERQIQEQQWQRQEQQNQHEFEIKFNQGAAKYQDFEQVVLGKSLTPQMVIATRGMNDPAAFIYAAAKTQANELDRISRINDPYSQAVELGKLEERMRKSRPTSSNAPKPIDQVKGDSFEKPTRPKSIDDKLIADQNERMKNLRSRR